MRRSLFVYALLSGMEKAEFTMAANEIIDRNNGVFGRSRAFALPKAKR